MRGLVLTGLETADLVDLDAKVAAREGQTRYTHQIGCFHRSGQRQPGRVAVGFKIGRGRLDFEQGQAKVGIAHRQADGTVIGRVLGVNAAVRVAVHPVGATHTCKGIDIGGGHGEHLGLHLLLVGQRDFDALFLEGGCAVQVNKASQVDVYTCGHAEGLAGVAIDRQAARAAGARHHVQTALGQVQHRLGGVIAQVDAHAHVAHRQIDVVGQAHEGRFVRIRFQGHAHGHVEVWCADGCAVNALVMGQARQAQAGLGLAQRYRAPVDALGIAHFTPAAARVGRQPNAAAAAAGGRSDRLAVGRHTD